MRPRRTPAAPRMSAWSTATAPWSSLTNTLLSRFGSKVDAAAAGILMNNGMMWFDPRPGQPNSIAAGAQAARQHVSAHLSPRRQAVAGDRRRRRPHHLPDRAAARLRTGRFRPHRSRTPSICRASTPATPTIKVNARAGADVAATVATRLPRRDRRGHALSREFLGAVGGHARIRGRLRRHGASDQPMGGGRAASAHELHQTSQPGPVDRRSRDPIDGNGRRSRLAARRAAADRRIWSARAAAARA